MSAKAYNIGNITNNTIAIILHMRLNFMTVDPFEKYVLFAVLSDCFIDHSSKIGLLKREKRHPSSVTF